MASVQTFFDNSYETLKNQALERNDRSVATWSKYKDDLEVTKSLLSLIHKKMKHDVMVPIGGKALMRGKIVHTNEFLVNLGETWFVNKTAHQTSELCDRRIKSCNEMLEKLEKERELIINKSSLPAEQEAFGSEERPEIIEYVTEEENEEWKKLHRIREKKYRQQLAELRNQEKKPIETEEDLWKHLDELELQEELEDELNRLNTEYSSGEDFEDNSEADSTDKQSGGKTIDENNLDSDVSVSNTSVKKKVFFEDELNSSDTEPLTLEIKHSEWEPPQSGPNSTEINSPADIYNKFVKSLNEMPLSILKNNVSHLKEVKKLVQCDEVLNAEYEENTSTGVHLNDVTERFVFNISKPEKVTNKTKKKISKFKTSRTKC